MISTKNNTVESCNFEVLGTRDFHSKFQKLELQGGRQKNIYPPKMIIISYFLSNICFVYVKETSQGDVSFTHTKHVFL